jgi:MoaA/NifB/PqqE/SkfB family radical SAM enzyme
MDVTEARHAIDQIKQFPKSLFLPQGFGEPLLHPDFLDVLAYARSTIKNRIILITNGTLLSKDMSREIVKRSLADAIVISVETGRKEDYEKTRIGGDFDQLDRNISEFIELRRECGETLPNLLLRGVALDASGDVRALLNEKWGRLLSPSDGIGTNYAVNWAESGIRAASAGMPKDALSSRRRLACRRLWYSMTVGLQKDVTPCCLDYDFRLSVGNIDKNSLRDIWQGKRLAELREAHLRRDLSQIPLCSTCNDWE